MKQLHYIYTLIDEDDKVLYVGCSIKPVDRLYSHVKRKPCATKRTGTGYFYGRTDIRLDILSSFNNRKAALLEEGKVKKLHGLTWTERTKTPKQIDVCASGGKVTMAKLNKIPHICTCGRVIKGVGALAMHKRGKGH